MAHDPQGRDALLVAHEQHRDRFEFASNWSYVAVIRLPEATARAGLTVRWKPFLLGPSFQSFGCSTLAIRHEEGEGCLCVARYPERQRARHEIPWRQPTQFPRRSLRPMRAAILGAEQPWIAAFCQRTMLQNFRDDTDIDGPRWTLKPV